MRFECQPGCVRCCTRKGVVYLTRKDIARIAAHLGLARAEFERRYVCGRAPLRRFRLRSGRPCPFLMADGCSIHAVKPLQCSSFPFWPELLSSAAERGRAAKYCPGMNRGKLVDLEGARAVSSEVRQAFPHLYGISDI